MSYPVSSRRAGLAVAVEAQRGVDAAPTMADNAVRLLETPTYEDFYLAENDTSEIITGKLGFVTKAPMAARAMRFRCSAPIYGPGTAYSETNLPELDPIWQALTMSRTIDTGTDTVTYEFADDSGSDGVTVTAILQMDGKEFKITHAVVEEMSIAIDAAGFAMVNFTLVGIAHDPVEADTDEGVFHPSNFPIWKGADSLVMSGVSLRPRQVELAMNIEVGPRLDANTADGHAGYVITSRFPTIRVRGEVPALSDWNPFLEQKENTSRTMDIALNGGAFNSATLHMGDLRARGTESTDENRLRYFDVTYNIAVPDTGTEFSITYS